MSLTVSRASGRPSSAVSTTPPVRDLPLRRAVRVARGLALGAGIGSLGSLGCTLESSPHAAREDAQAEATTDAHVAEAATDARPHVDAVVVDALADGDETGEAAGHCYAPDDKTTITCAAGLACSTDELGYPECVEPPTEFDAGVQPCGKVGCLWAASCFCANAETNFCQCTTSAGPLPPPDLPVA